MRLLAHAATAAAVAIGTFVVTALGGFWDAAAREQHAILTSLQRAAPSLPASSTVVLDHVCPEAGPAVVFGDEWDFRNAVVLAYDDPSLRADTATDELAARPRGLRLSNMFLGRTSTRTYAYGPRLFVYDYPRRALEPLPTRSAAARYVAARPPMRCMPQRGFAWGLDPFSRTSLP